MAGDRKRLRPVVDSTSSATASQLASLRLATTTSAPAVASPSTISRPSPRLPPVTTATRSERSKSLTAAYAPISWAAKFRSSTISSSMTARRISLLMHARAWRPVLRPAKRVRQVRKTAFGKKKLGDKGTVKSFTIVARARPT